MQGRVFCAGLWNNLINERLKYHETAILSHSIIEAKLIWTYRWMKVEAMSIVIKISSVCCWPKKTRFICDFLKIADHIDVLGERKTWDLSCTQSREIYPLDRHWLSRKLDEFPFCDVFINYRKSLPGEMTKHAPENTLASNWAESMASVARASSGNSLLRG